MLEIKYGYASAIQMQCKMMQIRIFFVYSHHHKHNYKDSAMMRGTGKRPSFLLFANTNFRVKPP